jgi:hypothetical protein
MPFAVLPAFAVGSLARASGFFTSKSPHNFSLLLSQKSQQVQLAERIPRGPGSFRVGSLEGGGSIEIFGVTILWEGELYPGIILRGQSRAFRAIVPIYLVYHLNLLFRYYYWNGCWIWEGRTWSTAWHSTSLFILTIFG